MSDTIDDNPSLDQPHARGVRGGMEPLGNRLNERMSFLRRASDISICDSGVAAMLTHRLVKGSDRHKERSTCVASLPFNPVRCRGVDDAMPMASIDLRLCWRGE